MASKFLIILFGHLLVGCLSEPPYSDQHHCQPIRVSMCIDMPYNETVMPNLLKHNTQKEAEEQVKSFIALVRVNCSVSLRTFLCTLYVPVCTNIRQPLPPCRSLCESARQGCEDVMKKFGFDWPDVMECSNFPERSDDAMCVPGSHNPVSPVTPSLPGQPKPKPSQPSPQQPNTPQPNPKPHPQPPQIPDPQFPNPQLPNPQFPNPQLPNPQLPNVPIPDDGHPNLPDPQTPGKQGQIVPFDPKSVISLCPHRLRVESEYNYNLVIPGGKLPEIKNCGAPCHGVFFNKKDEQFARYWIGIWALVCLFSTLFTILTFLVDMRRFRYPERPIIFLSVCYFVVSLCYVVGFFMEDGLACKKVSGPHGTSYVATQGTKSEGCTIIFLLIYFFMMASSIWWVILTLTWYLAAGLKWGHEAIENNSQYFHLAAWALPAVIAITVTALSEIDGDVLSGVCFTGITSQSTQIGFILAPLCVFLVVGIGFLIAGFVSLFHIRTVMKHGGTKTDKLEKLMVRIGIFSVLYIIPATIVIICNVIEIFYKDIWVYGWYDSKCAEEGHPFAGYIPCELGTSMDTFRKALPFGGVKELERPPIALFAFKYLGYLVVGITSGIWIWSGKTMLSWKRFFLYMIGRENGRGTPV